jgi:transcriptional regulator with XRE-family HTH domain
MARAALRLGVRDLAKLADLSPMTVTRLENGTSGGHVLSIRKIQAALEAEGIEFIDGDAPGVKLRKTVSPKPKKKKKTK